MIAAERGARRWACYARFLFSDGFAVEVVRTSMIPAHLNPSRLKLLATVVVFGFALWGLMDILAVTMEAGWARSHHDARNQGLSDREPQAASGSEREGRPRSGRSRLVLAEREAVAPLL